MEDACAREIIRATWRLNRCAEVEQTNEDPDVQNSVDRARAQALNTFLKATAELRRLQTDRRIAAELNPEATGQTPKGIAAQKQIVLAVAAEHRRRAAALKSGGSFCKTPQPVENEAPQIARNALCPCNSGQKYKRCCGRNAPPVLFPQQKVA